MKHFQLAILALITMALFTGAANAQKKTTKKTTKKPVVTKAVIPPLEVRAAREKVVIQQENVIFWIDKLGPIAAALELLDQTYAKKRPSPATLATHEDRKQKFVQTLRNLRGDLNLLESEFRTKFVLQKYLPSLLGITDQASQSEDLAIAGKFVAAKEPLREVAKRLTDTLAVLPK